MLHICVCVCIAEQIGIDPSANMLSKGREKVAAKGLQDVITLQLGDAQALSDLPDASFDKVCALLCK
jgi:ubiquinone/menaquinone biosynthesis C-methylase UbiE